MPSATRIVLSSSMMRTCVSVTGPVPITPALLTPLHLADVLAHARGEGAVLRSGELDELPVVLQRLFAIAVPLPEKPKIVVRLGRARIVAQGLLKRVQRLVP